MATDGVKIIDGDLAHDTYTEIIRLFDEGREPGDIRNMMPLNEMEHSNYDEFYYEIYVTAYALAMWEIGGLTPEIIAQVEWVLEKSATVKIWTEEYDKKAGNARKKVLARFWAKINRPNPRVRRRRTVKTLIRPVFEENTLLAFLASDGQHHVCLCSKVAVRGRKAAYTIVCTTYNSPKFPDIQDVIDLELWGTRIGFGGNPESASAYQPGVELLWDLFPEPIAHLPGTRHFIVGLCECIISHKDLVSFSGRFTKIGSLKIKASFNRQGSGGFVDTFEAVVSATAPSKNSRCIKLPIRLICEV